jgi:hypothetical protein
VRIWSLHPKYLDRAGLTAAWREALLAQKVLQGGTRGYRHHPQLARFRSHPDPEAAIGAFLRGLKEEASTRGYRFDGTKIAVAREPEILEVTTGQIAFELRHLVAKLERRAPERLDAVAMVGSPMAHPLFRVVDGLVAEWERTAS